MRSGKPSFETILSDQSVIMTDINVLSDLRVWYTLSYLIHYVRKNKEDAA